MGLPAITQFVHLLSRLGIRVHAPVDLALGGAFLFALAEAVAQARPLPGDGLLRTAEVLADVLTGNVGLQYKLWHALVEECAAHRQDAATLGHIEPPLNSICVEHVDPG